jgi:hypothetical protein
MTRPRSRASSAPARPDRRRRSAHQHGSTPVPPLAASTASSAVSPNRAPPLRQPNAIVTQVDAEGFDAGGACYSDGQLPDQAQSDHRHTLADLHVRQPQPVQSDRPQRGKGPRVERDVIWEPRHEQARHGGVLAVHRVTTSGTRHAIARPQIVDPIPDLDDGAGRRITEGHRLCQTGAHGVHRRQDSLPARLLQRWRNQIRMGALPGSAGEVCCHPFGS